MSEEICPDCKRPVQTHEMFDPPRCPVIRIKWSLPDPVDWEWPKNSYIDYRELRSWLRHPIQTYLWWTHPQAPRNGG